MVKDLKYFMRKQELEIIKALGPDTFKDENGKTIELEIKVLPQIEISKINDRYEKKGIATDKKGNPIVSGGEVVWKKERDNERALRHVIVEALEYPNLKDPELMKFYDCVDVTEMPLLVFSRTDEYTQVLKTVMIALGLREKDDTDEENIEEAKN